MLQPGFCARRSTSSLQPWPQFIALIEDAAEHIAWDRHLGHLEDRLAGRGNHFRAGYPGNAG